MATLVDKSQNKLLAAMPENDWRQWQSSLETIALPVGMVLHEPRIPLQHLYFPTTAVVSLVHKLSDGAVAQFSMVGYDGLVGLPILLGSDSPMCRAVVQIAGNGYRLPAEHIKRSFHRSIQVMRLMLRYTQVLTIQMSHTAVCNRHHSIDQRLCRWLLVCQDNVRGCELVVTHDLISEMLGVRRSGVTGSAFKLQTLGLIRYSRGRITILNRSALESRACECYQAVKRDSAELLPDVALV